MNRKFYNEHYQKATYQRRKDLGVCVRCGHEKERKDVLKCNTCTEYQRVLNNHYKIENKQKGLCRICRQPANARLCLVCKAITNKRCNERRRQAKIETINFYGGKCACCNEARLPFLSMDHINGDGATHRRQLREEGRSSTIFEWLKKNNYPSGFRVYCHNCNLGSYLNGGICPHAEQQAVATTV